MPDQKPQLEHGHAPEEIAGRLASGPRINYLRDWIYGGIDGVVTTFAIVAGAVGADLSAKIILILGLANLFADGFSMAAANYSGTKSERDDYDRLRRIEEKHIRFDPDGEREEIRQIYESKGFEGAELTALVKLVTSRRTTWIETMMLEEYGLSAAARSPVLAGLVTFAAFVVFGSIPLIPYGFGWPASALITAVMTAVTFFAIGSIKARWSTRNWLLSGLETLLIGMLAAGIAFGVGHLLRNLVA
ncbi:VIT1/CCC1 transporter family protein [Roseibium sp. RKSG952]|uniref:VIT1/CCC1 transporter family protein n=1 Tax=Roseibium sp. RKSG952 TaxID=2529384 RepID=UPI0012BB7699|nr:VIT1/CCC1 transporter family protein [Roseibium sp. RKSG952]MTH96800.1 hypothetical protein [Roseibium sp. RKSG952]